MKKILQKTPLFRVTFFLKIRVSGILQIFKNREKKFFQYLFFGHKLDFHYTVSFVDISEMRYVRLILNHSVSILSELIDGLNG